MAALYIALALCLCMSFASAQISCNKACPTGSVNECTAACTANTNMKCMAFSCVSQQCVGTGGNCMSVRSDPELKGMDGRKFYFDGIAGKVFNLVSQKEHQINALFVEGPHRIAVHGNTTSAHNGTYVGALGMKLHNTKLEIAVDEEGDVTAAYNGKAIVAVPENDYVAIFNDEMVNVTYEEYKGGVGQAVSVKTDLYDLLVYATRKEYNAEEKQITRGHLNMILSVNEDVYHMTEVHGVLGQISPDSAADNTLLAPELQTAFLGEGVDADYIVSDLFADDFKYNRFGQQAAHLYAGTVETRSKSQLTASKRRLAGISSSWVALGRF